MTKDTFNVIIGNYRLLQLSGSGGYATVYLGEHVTLETRQALKVLRKKYAHDAEKIAEFYEEARKTAHLRHRSIVPVFNCGRDGERHFYVMDYAPFGSLRQFCQPDTLLPLHQVIRYIRQAAEALYYVHGQGFIHRDVKPENLLINQRRNIWLCDFGIAVPTHGGAYAVISQTRGTVGYMSPEHYRHQLYPASDQYSLAVVAYELLVGTAPFHGTAVQVAQQHQHTHPPSLRAIAPSIPLAVEQVVMRALSKDHDDRYPDVMAFADALEQAYYGGQTLHIPSQSYSVSRPPRVQTYPLHDELLPPVKERLPQASRHSEPLSVNDQSSDAIPYRRYAAQQQSSAMHPPVSEHRQPAQPGRPVRPMQPARPAASMRRLVASSRRRKSPLHPLNTIETIMSFIASSIVALVIAGMLYYVGVGLGLSLVIACVILLVLLLSLPRR